MRSCARRGETRAWDKGPQHSWHVSDRPAPARAPCERIARGDLIIVVTGYCVASELYHQEQKTSRCGIDTVCASLSSLDSIARGDSLSLWSARHRARHTRHYLSAPHCTSLSRTSLALSSLVSSNSHSHTPVFHRSESEERAERRPLRSGLDVDLTENRENC